MITTSAWRWSFIVTVGIIVVMEMMLTLVVVIMVLLVILVVVIRVTGFGLASLRLPVASQGFEVWAQMQLLEADASGEQLAFHNPLNVLKLWV